MECFNLADFCVCPKAGPRAQPRWGPGDPNQQAKFLTEDDLRNMWESMGGAGYRRTTWFGGDDPGAAHRVFNPAIDRILSLHNDAAVERMGADYQGVAHAIDVEGHEVATGESATIRPTRHLEAFRPPAPYNPG